MTSQTDEFFNVIVEGDPLFKKYFDIAEVALAVENIQVEIDNSAIVYYSYEGVEEACVK
jgi:hypothetical protein